MARTRPHFKVHTTALHHPKMSAVIADNELFGLWVKFGVLAIERYASKNNDEFNVSHSELLGLTNRKRIDKAILLVRKLADNSTLSVSSSGHSITIKIPNLAIKQGFHSKKVQESPPTTTKHKHIHSVDSSGASGGSLSDRQIAAMIAVRPGGALYSEREVRAWVDWIAPQIASRGISDVPKTTLAWWPSARIEAVQKAVQWVASIQLADSNTRSGNPPVSETISDVPLGIWRDEEGETEQ